MQLAKGLIERGANREPASYNGVVVESSHPIAHSDALTRPGGRGVSSAWNTSGVQQEVCAHPAPRAPEVVLDHQPSAPSPATSISARSLGVALRPIALKLATPARRPTSPC